MTHHPLRRYGTLLGMALAAFATGCQSPPDRLVFDNYTLVRQNASTQADVAALLGEPAHRLGDMWMYERPDRHLVVMIDFNDKGKVDRKQWVDAGEEYWDDSDD